MTSEDRANEEKQCRICLDGVSAQPELGRLISPCQCKGSIRYVHVKCLHTWRKASLSRSAFFACPQCHYQYRFARAQVVGLATNQAIVAILSGLVFTFIVMLASFISTYFMSSLQQPSIAGYQWSYFGFVSPFDVAKDLIAAAFRVLSEGDIFLDSEEEDAFPLPNFGQSDGTHTPPGVVMRFIRRFLLGLPLVGAVSVVHLLMSFQALFPVQLLARYRGSRNRNNNRDVAAFIVVALIVVGALRAYYKVFKATEHYVKRGLLRAEDAILEVNHT